MTTHNAKADDDGGANDDDGVDSVFRPRWRAHHSSGSRPGELIRQPRWVDVALVVLGVLLAAGAAAAATVAVDVGGTEGPAPLISVMLPRLA
jgi:hypothetical protein